MSTKKMEFVYVEVTADSKIHKNLLVVVKALKGILKECESFVQVKRILSEMESVEHGTYCTNEARRGLTTREFEVDDEAEKDAADIVMFLAAKPG
jgi:hypothetical protein